MQQTNLCIYPETNPISFPYPLLFSFDPPQATLPDYQPIENYRSEDDEERDLEDPRWTPGIYIDNDLLMYLTAARSISAFQGMCEEDGCMAASRDDTTINAFDVVSSHPLFYNTRN